MLVKIVTDDDTINTARTKRAGVAGGQVHALKKEAGILTLATVCVCGCDLFFFFSSRRRHTRLQGDWSSDVCSSDLLSGKAVLEALKRRGVDAHAFDPRDAPLSDLIARGFERVWIALHGPGGEDGDRKSVV